MENLLLILVLLACPLGMLLMGAVAWMAGKTFWRRSGATTDQPHG